MREIVVHLFETSRAGDYQLQKCNCGSLLHNLSGRSHSPNRSGINVDGVNQYLGSTGGVLASQYMMPTALVCPYAGYQQTPTYTTPLPYARSTTGLPVNISYGAYITEAQGIFIRNLNNKVSLSELNELLRSVGRPIESRLHNDTRTGVFRGVATAKFATEIEAKHAVQVLNNTQHMGRSINVRLDTERRVVGQTQGPLIVYGSNTSSV